MVSRIILILLAGALGGVLRGVLGIAKELVTKKDATVNWPWFWVSVAIAAILGVITATFFLDDLRIALIGGYAGSDFLEGLMKITLKNRFGPNKQTEKKSQFGELLKNAGKSN
jgi:hypothetical protein